MSLTPSQIRELAESLWQAEQTRTPTALLSARYPQLDENDAYLISAAKFALRNSAKTGYKLGYTSAAMRRQMNISSPNYGVLSKDQLVHGGTIPHEELIHPLVEPEIAIRLTQDLPQIAIHDKASVLQGQPEFMLAIEVCDSRYPSYDFKAVDNIADNSSAARYVLGNAAPIESDDYLKALDVELWIDGELLDKGMGGNALGDPLLAVAWLATRLASQKKSLQSGDVILTGGLTKGYRVEKGQLVAHRAGSAEVSVHFV